LETAFVLINAETGMAEELLESLKSLPIMKEAYRVSGEYEIIARFETYDVKKTVNRIRLLDGVHSTLTMITL
jgi:DNA-binding Lrp family transcriptional regulator